MNTKKSEIPALLVEYDNVLSEIKRLEETKKEIIKKLWNTELPDGSIIRDVVKQRFNYVLNVIRKYYPEDSCFRAFIMDLVIKLRSIQEKSIQEEGEFTRYSIMEMIDPLHGKVRWEL